MINLSLCMIVKNEIDVLERCINSVSSFIDEIILVDTGSTDGTLELAKTLNCTVYNFEWCNDFSVARNFSISKAKNDWILILDADEYVDSIDLEIVSKFLNDNNNLTLGEVSIKNLHDDTFEKYVISNICRLFNKNFFEYKRSIHEFIECKNDNWKENYCLLPININHTGYIKEVYNKKDKAQRNINLILDELKKERDPYLIMHLAKSYMSIDEYEKAIAQLEEVLNNDDCIKYTYYKNCVVEYIKCFLNTNQFEKSLTCEKYWDRCNTHDEYIYYMGHVYMKNGLFENAMDCFLYVGNLENPTINKNNAYFSLAQMFEVLGFIEESITYYKMCGTFQNSDKKVLELEKN